MGTVLSRSPTSSSSLVQASSESHLCSYACAGHNKIDGLGSPKTASVFSAAFFRQHFTYREHHELRAVSSREDRLQRVNLPWPTCMLLAFFYSFFKDVMFICLIDWCSGSSGVCPANDAFKSTWPTVASNFHAVAHDSSKALEASQVLSLSPPPPT